MNETGAKDSGWAWPSADRWPDTSAATSASPAPRPEIPASSSSCATPAPTAPPAPATPRGSAAAGSVLIVEDDRAARTAIAKLLKRQGFAVSEAATVAAAMEDLERSAAAPPQWVLLDLMLPDGCGISVLRHLRAARLPSTVCVITGCGNSAVLAEARRAGAEHTFAKPLNVDELLTLMLVHYK